MSDGVQYGIDAVLGLVVTVGGMVVNALRSDHKDLRGAHDRLVADLPNTYARRDDVKDAFMELKAQHKEINAKLDRLIERG